MKKVIHELFAVAVLGLLFMFGILFISDKLHISFVDWFKSILDGVFDGLVRNLTVY